MLRLSALLSKALCVSSFAAAMATVGVASADAAAPDSKPIAYSYEIANADVNADRVIVVWPRNCGSYGDPLGKVDLALNPDWESRQHDVDYEVVVKGKKHELLDQCSESARFYALPLSAFPRGTRTATADDSAIGQEAGAPFAILPALDEITLTKRIELLGKDPRVLRASFRVEPMRTARHASTLQAVHDVLEVGGFGETAFSIVPKHVVYTYVDGRSETVDFVGAQRRPPTRASALEGDAGAQGATDAAAIAKNASADVPPPAPTSDFGTRWVFLAAVGGLVLGGLIALARKKSARAQGASGGKSGKSDKSDK